MALTLTLAALIAAGCQLLSEATPTPLPGWYGDTSELLIPESALPDGWYVLYYQETNVHPRANHVHREASRRFQSGVVIQDVWRAYTVDAAEAKYDELRESVFHPNSPLPEYMVFVEFEPPTEISFQSRAADEFYLACGWWNTAICNIVARYQNYAVLLRLPHEAEFDRYHTSGMTYSEIEAVVRAMDARFEQVMNSFITPAP